MADKITLQTIESLPLVEEVNENTSLVGWDGERTVRVSKNAVGSSGGSGIFVVRISLDSDYNPFADKTFAETLAAWQNGSIVFFYFAQNGGGTYDITHLDKIYFEGEGAFEYDTMISDRCIYNFSEGSYRIKFTKDDNVEIIWGAGA